MAWHIFERLLDEVANQSTHFIGKVWITSLFMFRLITVASIGDAIYHDEWSAFLCNTLQPGCTNVCFNEFTPISQIRFYAFQILLVGTPSVIYIIYAVHKRSRIPPSSVKVIEKDHETAQVKEETSSEENESTKSSTKIQPNTWSVSSKQPTAPPDYKDVYTKDGTISSIPDQQKFLHDMYVNRGDLWERRFKNNLTEKEPSSNGLKHRKKKKTSRSKPTVKRKVIYKHDVRREIVTTPHIQRAYFVHVLVRCSVEGVFLYFQYSLYKFDVDKLYICEVDPCPRIVECFVSRPMEKTIFLLFMYALTSLSLLLNLIEVYVLAQKRLKRFFRKSSETIPEKRNRSTGYYSSQSKLISDRPTVIQLSSSSSDVRTFPRLHPFPRTHSNSFGGLSRNGSIDSSEHFYSTSS